MVQSLFPPILPKTVIAHDIKGNCHEVSTELLKMRVSVYGILTNTSGAVLLQRHPSANKFALPGGGVDIGETVTQALVREFKEETNLNIKIGQLLDICDDYFTHDGKYCQTVMIFYSVTSFGKNLINQNEEDVAETKFVTADEISENLIQAIHWPIIKKHYLETSSKPTITTK